MPKSAMTRIRLPSQTVPPREAIESPNTVVISDPERNVGRARNSSSSFLQAVSGRIGAWLALSSPDRTI